MPLRPLGLGDIYDAAFRIIRYNPMATVGAAALVSVVAMLVPVVVTSVLTFTMSTTLDPDDQQLGTAEAAGLIGSFGSLGLGLMLQAVGTILVTGMIAHVTGAAAVGRRVSLGEAWRATHGKRWRLIGLTLLLGLLTTVILVGYVLLWVVVVTVVDSTSAVVVWGLLTVPAFLAFLAWFYVRVAYLPVPALMLEPVGVTAAIGRGYRLTRRQFWRVFGIALLTMLIAGVASEVLVVPVSLAGQAAVLALGAEYAVLGTVVLQAVASVLQTAFVAPFTGSVTSLQYLDQRMRKEGYDVELMTRAGITAP